MQTTFMDGSKGEIENFELSKMFDILENPLVAKVEVFNLDNTNTIVREPPTLTRADVVDIIKEYEAKRNVYKEYFELTREVFKRKGLLKPKFYLNRKHY